jgi:putative oxidoreductase
MQKWLGKYEEGIYALFRFVFGFLFFCHGIQKLFGAFGGPGHAAGKFFVAGVIEVVAGPMIALGIFAGVAAFLASGEMAVAYFTMQLPRGFWPIQNRGELVVAFCFAFLLVAARGSGRCAIVPTKRR